jgi:rhodanese-related sulfurtransferase
VNARTLGPMAVMAAGAAFAAGPLTPGEVAQQLRDPKAAPMLLDVRTAEEFADGHAPGAVNIPLRELEARAGEVPQDRPVVVYCEHGGRATLAASQLRGRGHANVREMAGSMSAWRGAGLPIEK